MRNNEPAKRVYWLIPFLMFLVVETVMGNLRYIDPLSIVLNLGIFYMLYLGIYTIFRSTRIGWPALNVILYVFAVVEYFVISFRERPAMVWDVLAIRTAMTVSANYNYTITPTLVLTFAAMLLLSIWAYSCAKERPMNRIGKVRPWQIWLVTSASYMFALFQVLAPKFHLDVPMWDPVISFEREGVVLSSVLSLKSLKAPVPESYTTEHAEAIYEAAYSDIESEKQTEEPGNSISAEETPVVPANVICIMNESFSDLRIFNGLNVERSFETDFPFLPYFDSLSAMDNVQTGELYVPVFGAMTANSEYEFLTGKSCAFVPQGSIPYQFYTKPGDHSLAKIFDEHGYETIAMHPYPGYNWNRTEAYENLGFDRFLDGEFYDNLEEELETEFFKPREYMSDQSDFDVILHLLNEKEPDEKMFVFNVTMQNHGGFEVADLEAEVHVTSMNGVSCEGEYPKADQYLTLMKMSDEALKGFLEELEQVDEPTMVVMFGDHQPSVETAFFENLYGTRWTDVPTELKLNSFRTPYLIWTNYSRSAEDLGDMSAFMLGGEVLEAAGLERTGAFRLTEGLRENYDAVHAMGVLTKNGAFTDSRDSEKMKQYQDVLEYHTLEYYELFDRNNDDDRNGE